VTSGFWWFEGGSASDVPIAEIGGDSPVTRLGLTELEYSSPEPAGHWVGGVTVHPDQLDANCAPDLEALIPR
jgi:hypothetical protein